MKIFQHCLRIVAVLAFFSLGAQTVQAQVAPVGGATGGAIDTGGAATGAATGGATTGGTATNVVGGAGSTNTGQGDSSIVLETEVDTSAFTIERGATIGGSTGAGFGLGAETGGVGGFSAGGIGGGGLGAFGGLGGLNSLFGGGLGGSTQSKPIIRTRIRSAIKVDPISPARVQQMATTTLRQSPVQRRLPGVNVQMLGRTAVVSGTVSNQSDRRMAELLLRLEPGVSQVDNRVVVSP
jgi:hypothetical protein